MGRVVDQGPHRPAPLAEDQQREPRQNRHQQDLEDVALGKGAADAVRDQVKHEVDARLVLGLLGVALHHLGAGAGPAESPPHGDQVSDHHPDHQGEGRHHFEVHQRLEPDPTDLAGILDMRDPRHHRTENDRSDQHLDQSDESVTQGLGPGIGRHRWKRHADGDTEDNRHQDLDVENPIERFAGGCH